MALRKRLGALVAAGALALGSTLAVASPAYAAPSCTYRSIDDGYYFSCYDSVRSGAWVSITCTNIFLGTNFNIRREFRSVGYPWSWGVGLTCGSVLEIANNPRWGAL